MTTTTANIDDTSQTRLGRLREGLDAFFSGLGQGFNAYLVAKSRMPQMEALNAKSDEELAEMGLRREDIARHVFRDVLWL